MHDDKILPFLRKSIFDSRFKSLEDDLLRALLSIVHNVSDDERRYKIKPLFNDPLVSLISEPLDESIAERSLHDTTLQILEMISEGDKGYNFLMQIFSDFIKRNDPDYPCIQ